MKAACFSGHRPEKLPWGADEADRRCTALKLRILAAIFACYENGYTHFITGMAPGVDIYAAEAVLKLRGRCPITLECALPYRGHTGGRNAAIIARHAEILSQADRITVLAEAYTPYCMAVRNRYMVDNSSCLIAVYSGGSGGTANTIAYAQKKGREVILIPPYLTDTLEITEDT